MKRLLLFLTIFGTSLLILEAQTITWTGASDGINWSDPNNWDLTTIPTETHDVIIPDGSTLTLNVEASVKSIEVQGVSTVTISNTLSFSHESSFGFNSVINWYSGYLTGGGILTNKGTIDIMTTEWKGIWGSTLNNEGTINIISNGKFIIDSILNNQAMGIINLKGDEIKIGYAYGFGHTFNNYGTIIKSLGSGVSQISVWTNNFGTIEAMMGEIEFTDTFLGGLNNMGEGVIKGVATIDLPGMDPPVPGVEKFINSGTFSPGASPGTLIVIGDFTSSPSSKLAIEINGMNQGVNCDLLTIQGDAIFDGVLDVTMGIEGNINDKFVVVTTTGTITECSLESTTTSIYDGIQYNFDVACRNNNEVVLTIVDKTLGVDVNELTDANISLFPNPTTDIIRIKNNSEYDLVSATIIDIYGRVLETIELNEIGYDKVISLSDYASGHYFVKINSDLGNVIRRFIKL